MTTELTASLEFAPESLRLFASGPDGQSLIGQFPDGFHFEQRVLCGETFDQIRESKWRENLSRLLLVSHPSVRSLTDCQFDDKPLSFRLGLRSHLDPERDRLSKITGSIPIDVRLRTAAQIVDATESVHRVGAFHGSFAPSTILLDQSSAASLVQIDFSATACCDDVIVNELSVERDLFCLHRLLKEWLGPCVNDQSAMREHELLGEEEIEVLMDCLLVDLELSPSTNRWMEALGRYRPVSDQLDQTNDDTHEAPAGLSSVVREASDAQRVPARLGRFRLTRKIGVGGMGAVYQAVDQADGSFVAIKVIRNQGDQLDRSIRRFRKEARLLADVQNDYVTRLIEVGEDLGQHYLAMEFIDGVDLKQWLKNRGPLSEADALAIAADLARALVDAHSRGVVHRDIKPENVLLQIREDAPACEVEASDRPIGDFQLKLTDFGIARHVDQSESMEVTRAGSVLGTPKYMSPEQCSSSSKIGPTADVYAMGVTLFQMLAGEVPFDAADFMEIASLHCFSDVPSVQKRNALVTDRTAAIVQRAMAKSPKDRFGDAGQMLAELITVIRGEASDVEAHPRLPKHTPGRVFDKTVRWTLSSSPSELWPYVSNTERLNEAIGLPAVNYRTEHDPELGVRKFGSFVLNGLPVSWEEHPFEWVEGQRMGILREFDVGPFEWFLSRVVLQPSGDGGTKLSHQVTIQPRNLLGRVLTKLEADWKGFRNLNRVYQRMDRSIQGRIPPSDGTDAFSNTKAPSRDQKRRLSQRIEKLLEQGIQPGIASSIHSTLMNGSAQELSQIRPLALADRFELDGSETVDACLYAAREGLLRLRWEVLCPTCRVSASTSDQLSAIKAHTHCEACNVDFKSNLGDSIEMVFQAHPEVREINVGQYCIGGPEHSPHVVSQVRVESAERLQLQLDLGIGDYLIRGPQLPQTQLIHVQEASAPSVIDLALSMIGKGHHVPQLRTGRQTLTLINDLPSIRVVRVERTIPRNDVVTATVASANPVFRKLFPDQRFSSENAIETEVLAFVATSIQNIDQLYEQLGDAAAYALVHGYQESIAASVATCHGTIVKTMGERTLACFERRDDAVNSNQIIRQNLSSLTKESGAQTLQIGIGIHCGPTLVTTQNNQLDYFGGTVRATSAIPDVAVDSTLVSEAVYSDPAVEPFLNFFSESIQTITVPGTPMLRVRRIIESTTSS